MPRRELKTVKNRFHSEVGYVQANDNNGTHWNRAFSEFRGVYHSASSFFQDFSDLATNVSGRPGLTRDDYSAFRPQESLPTRHKEIIRKVNLIYYRVGLIRNIIDLMSEFGSQGIQIVHEDPARQPFYDRWSNLVHVQERSERFFNLFYRLGNVIIRRIIGRISPRNKLMRAVGQPDAEVPNLEFERGEIPIKYIFLDPSIIEVVGGPLSNMIGKPIYAIKLPRDLARLIMSPRNEAEREIVAQLPADIKRAATTNKPLTLPQDKVSAFFYKKDDWQTWAVPMIYGILNDIIILEKLKLADIAALDGAISNIRIFKLGDIENKIMPTEAAASKLGEILESNVGGGTMDLVWGPDIQLEESKTTVHQFLGEEKYMPHLNSIYAGMGIPPTLTGVTNSSGATNNFISLKTLIKRLEYGREMLTQFWDRELRIVAKAMGHKVPAKVEFGSMNLGDEESERSLWLQLIDRNIVSDEWLQRRLQADPEMERIRLNREHTQREQDERVPKSSPFHDPQFGVALKKVALQTGVLAPSEVGLRKDEKCAHLKTYNKEKGQKNALDLKPSNIPSDKKSGQPGQGRPKNSKDSKPRKQREFRPKNKAFIEVWASAALNQIDKHFNSAILSSFSKNNFRQLTAKEAEHAEKIKFGVLCNLEPLSDYENPKSLENALSKGNPPYELSYSLKEWIKEVSSELDRNLTLPEKNLLKAVLYAEYHGE